MAEAELGPRNRSPQSTVERVLINVLIIGYEGDRRSSTPKGDPSQLPAHK